MKINVAVAFSKNYGIGLKNNLPWSHLKEDIRLFSKRTIGSGNNAVIMGKNTWLSIPECRRPLKNRTNIVISSSLSPSLDGNLHIFSSINEAMSFCESSKYDELWVIGGSRIYDNFFNTYYKKLNRVYITYVFGDYECDTFINFSASNYCVEKESYSCEEKCIYLSCIHIDHPDNNDKKYNTLETTLCRHQEKMQSKEAENNDGDLKIQMGELNDHVKVLYKLVGNQDKQIFELNNIVFTIQQLLDRQPVVQSVSANVVEAIEAVKLKAIEAVKVEAIEAVKVEAIEAVKVEAIEAVKLKAIEAVKLKAIEAVKVEAIEAVKLEESVTESVRKVVGKIVICYTYYNSPSSNYNLNFFIKKELRYRDDVDYILVINGYECPIPLPTFDNLKVIKRENTGYDFGGHFVALNYIKEHNKKYDYFFFMNSGVCGPIIPNYLDNDTTHWSTYFIRKINDKVKLVGTTICCLPHNDAGGYGPKVEGFFFVTDVKGLKILFKEKTIFQIHENKYSAIVHGEYGLSNCILKNGYSIDCMISKYQGIDWTDEKNWTMNNNLHPSRKNSFYSNSLIPYELIFHKWFWSSNDDSSYDKGGNNFEMIKQYVENNC